MWVQPATDDETNVRARGQGAGADGTLGSGEAADATRLYLEEIGHADVQILKEGQISGLNGVMLATAAEAGMEAICLLGEMPFFAVGVLNPKASLRVLEKVGFERTGEAPGAFGRTILLSHRAAPA